MKKHREGRVLGALIWTLAVFAAGYATALHAPPLDEILEQWGVELHAREAPPDEPPPPLRSAYSPEDDVRDLLARVGEYAGAIRTRKDELETQLRESQISRNILASRGEPESSDAFRRLSDEQERYHQSLAVLDQHLEEALNLESRLQLLVDATAGVDATFVDDKGCLIDAQALLASMQGLGLEPARQ